MIVAAAVCVFIALASMQEASATPYAQHNIKDLVKDLNEIRSTTDPKAANMIKLVIKINNNSMLVTASIVLYKNIFRP